MFVLLNIESVYIFVKFDNVLLNKTIFALFLCYSIFNKGLIRVWVEEKHIKNG